MQTQAQIELEALDYGRERMARSMANNEEKGRADSNPYAQAIYRRFVLPLAAIIRNDLEVKRAGRRQAHVQLLKDIDPDASAYVAVRAAMLALLGGVNGRMVVSSIGKSVYNEHLLTHFADMNKELFYTLTNDFERKMSHDERHKMTVYKRSAKDAGLELPVWSAGDRDQVGAYLAEQLQQLGMLEVSMVHERCGRGMKTVIHAALTQDTMDVLEEIKGHVIETTPYFLPCVEKPLDWTSLSEGGYHTKEMQRLMPFCVKHAPSVRTELRNADMSKDMAALNALQSVKWRINEPMLAAIRRVHEHFDMEEIISQAELPKPPRPDWLVKDMDMAMLNDVDKEQEFKDWKRKMAEWHTEAKERGTKWGRFYNAMRIAEKFKSYPELYFVYFMDFRGRKYVQTSGVSPQGSDLQKALLEFAEGKPLHTQMAKDWFMITGANRYGFDKATLPDRIKWVEEREELLMSFAADPIANSGWTEADKPLQFLAWCMEFYDWRTYGDDFVSRISVGMDGSCNGLQNFSAMLRDEKGGIATNLVPPTSPLDVPNDIYGMVATRATELLVEAEDDEAGYRLLWLRHKLNRTLVKRSVMTLPYGSTRFSCADFIVGDYLRAGKAPEFAKAEYSKAAQYLSKFVWQAIGDVVVKAREAMEWLQKGARQIVKASPDRDVTIRWVTPTGFPVLQAYWGTTVHQIHTKLCGQARLKIHSDADEADLNRHKNGIAPNFVHALDASHLTAVVGACEAAGIHALHMVHDDFGTHAADAGALYGIIRTTFLDMYTSEDPLEEFHKRYPDLPERPALGNLDLNGVLKSPYFFS